MSILCPKSVKRGLYLQLSCFIFVTLPSTRRCRPRLEMQPLQQWCATPRLALEAPVLAHKQHELALLAEANFANILQDAIDDDLGHERWAGLIRFRVSTRSLGGLRGVCVGRCGRFRLERGQTGFGLFTLQDVLAS